MDDAEVAEATCGRLQAVSWAELERVGLYDPNAAQAEERRALLEYLVDQGLTVEQMIGADRKGRLPLAAADPLIRGGSDRLTLAQAAARVDVPVDLAERIWRAAGFVDPGAAEVRVYPEAYVDVLRLLREAAELFGEDATLGLVRVFGSSLARIAEAELATSSSQVDAPLLSAGGDSVALARASVQTAAMLPLVARALDVLHRLHIEAGIGRLAFTVDALRSDANVVHRAIGFADLCGFATLSQDLSGDDLSQALRGFEMAAIDAASRADGRLVKLIGDEAMIVAGDPGTLVDIVSDLMGAVEAHPSLPPLRVGVAVGAVLLRDGDYFGPTVNLAARLTSAATKREVLMSHEVYDALVASDSGYACRPVGARMFKGFPQPIEVFALAPVEPHSGHTDGHEPR